MIRSLWLTVFSFALSLAALPACASSRRPPPTAPARATYYQPYAPADEAVPLLYWHRPVRDPRRSRT